MYWASVAEAFGGLNAGLSVSVAESEKSTMYQWVFTYWESAAEALGGLDIGLSVMSVTSGSKKSTMY